jgi:hypothetical protein
LADRRFAGSLVTSMQRMAAIAVHGRLVGTLPSLFPAMWNLDKIEKSTDLRFACSEMTSTLLSLEFLDDDNRTADFDTF